LKERGSYKRGRGVGASLSKTLSKKLHTFTIGE